jgi:hypothetical protein
VGFFTAFFFIFHIILFFLRLEALFYFAAYLFCGLLFSIWRFDLTLETFVTEFVSVPQFIHWDMTVLIRFQLLFCSCSWFQVRVRIGSL